MQHELDRKFLTLPRVTSLTLTAAFLASSATASDILYLAPNADATFGQSYSSLEFDNPIPPDLKVAGWRVLEWRDAGYHGGSDYEDWTVNDGAIDGYKNEIWLRSQGHSATTTTTQASRAVSIHLHGDSNDGIGDIYVDGLLVATLDMVDSFADNCLVLVHDLADTTHTVTVIDAGPGAGGGHDVAIMGAAALDDSRLGENYCTALPNSSGVPAEILAAGIAFAGRNDLILEAVDMPQKQFGYFLTSETEGFVHLPAGSQGNLCLGGKILRFSKQVLYSGMAGAFNLTLDLTDFPQGQAAVAGETWHFQAWFRDKNPDPTSNFTDGVKISFL